MIVKLSKKGLEADVQAGMKRSEIAEKYKLSVSLLNKAFKQAGLTGMRAKSVSFEFTDDEEDAIQEVTQPTAPEIIYTHGTVAHPDQD